MDGMTVEEANQDAQELRELYTQAKEQATA
jgi:predicted RNase H-like HicB family nuclease